MKKTHQISSKYFNVGLIIHLTAKRNGYEGLIGLLCHNAAFTALKHAITQDGLRRAFAHGNVSVRLERKKNTYQ